MRSKGAIFFASKSAWRAARDSRALPTLMSTREESLARLMFEAATAAWWGSSSSVTRLPEGWQSAGQPDGAVSAEGSDFEDSSYVVDASEKVKKLALVGCDVDGGKSGLRVCLNCF
jgi:hypothetical protein